jgi:hypothetical protein
MQTYQITIEDSVSDKVLWFLENLKEFVTIESISEKEKILKSIETGLKEAKMIEAGRLESTGTLQDLIEELESEN